MSGWESPPQGFEIKPLPPNSNVLYHVGGAAPSPVETIAVNDANERALADKVERVARQRHATTIYLGDPEYRELPEVLHGSLTTRKQWFCYAAFSSDREKQVTRKSGLKLDAPAIGFRAFSWDGGPLLGIGFGAEWPVQKTPQVANCAHCQGTPSSKAMGSSGRAAAGLSIGGSSEKCAPHIAPQEACSCGVYALNNPKRVSGGVIRAVTIGYGKLIVHPDGWRAEKSELIGLIVPPEPSKKCEHQNYDLQLDVCRECGKTKIQQQIELELEFQNERYFKLTAAPMMTFLRRGLFPSLTSTHGGPSRSALEILAEQYGARVIESWDDGIALAQEQGAKPIPDEVYEEARRNSWQAGIFPEGGTEGYLIPPEWITQTATEFSTRVKTLVGQTSVSIQAMGQLNESMKSSSLWTPPSKSKSPKRRKKSAIDDALKLKREKRELHARHWGHDAKAA